MRPFPKRLIVGFLAITIALTTQIALINPALAATPPDKEYREYSKLNQKIEVLQNKIPEGYYYPWSEFSLNERIKICKLELKIIDYKEERLIFEEANDLPTRTATWSYIAITRAFVGQLLEDLLAQRRGP